VGWQSFEWIRLAQVRNQDLAVVNKVMNLLILQNAGNIVTTWKSIRFSRRPLLHDSSRNTNTTSSNCGLRKYRILCTPPMYCTFIAWRRTFILPYHSHSCKLYQRLDLRRVQSFRDRGLKLDSADIWIYVLLCLFL
jgi:hypothetical protein